MWIWAEVFSAIFPHGAGDENPRNILFDRQCEIREGFIVSEDDVVLWSLLLNPGELQLEGFNFVSDNRPFNAVGFPDHPSYFLIKIALEICTESRSKILSLPNIDNLAVFVKEPIYARRSGNIFRAITRWISHDFRRR